MSTRTPERLVARVDDSASDSFEHFVHATAGRMHRTALLLTGEHHAAEDLTQATYAKVFASWRRVRSADDPAAYCRTVLTRTWLSHRRLRRSSEQPVDAVPEGVADAADPTQRLDLMSALGRLSPQDRSVLVLRFYEDLGVPETAALLGIGEAATRKRCQRALDRLRDLLPELDLTDPARDEVTR